MQTHEIRQRFVDHFVKLGHHSVPSASLVLDDPNLMFVVAGMVPFAPYFLGDQQPEYSRITSVQKCVRTLDIEEVGITTRHNTFFQMAGNFSFGDYFKREAISFAWTLLTGAIADGGYGIDPNLLWPSVYVDDDEAFAIWRDEIGIPEARITRRGVKDNLWSMGVPGPCGPSSEIFFDRGPDYGQEGGPAVDEDRYIEIWNLVFMQNIRGEGGGKENFEIIGELPQKNIDTGLGIERVACILQGVSNVYETDLLRPVIDEAAKLTGLKYGENNDNDVRFRVIADHARTAVMLIADGVTPSNEGRGYVLRRLVRRVVRSAKLLGAQDNTVGNFVDVVINTMATSYPELKTSAERIKSVAVAEEVAFSKTLTAGSKLFDERAATAKKSGSTTVSGADAFALHDTYGFPIDLTLEMASEAGLTVDEQSFRLLMTEQRTRAKADAQSRKSAHADLSVYKQFLAAEPTEFTGFTELSSEARVLGIVSAGLLVPRCSVGEGGVGESVEIILDRTPLYAEAGGQIADIGSIVTAAGLLIEISDVQKIGKKIFSHRGVVTKGEVAQGDTVEVHVDATWRRGATQGHSGTHLIGGALRQVLGANATQAGSLNKPGYLRFDFNAAAGLTEMQRAEIEFLANEAVLENYPVKTFETDLAEAKSLGAMALFGENYGDRVRVVDIGGPFSMELCGGTHVASSAEIGSITVISEGSVGSGVRRVEAYVGLDSYRHLATERALLAAVSGNLKVPAEQLPERIELLTTKLRDAEKQLAGLRAEAAKSALGSLLDQAVRVGVTQVIAAQLPDGLSGNDLRAAATDLRGRIAEQPAVIALFSVTDGKVPFVVATTESARQNKLAAGEIVTALAPMVGGRGGGKADLAQGSGTDPGAVAVALTKVADVIGEMTN